MQTLCPHCGTRNTHHWLAISSKCTSCGRRLPPTLPRNVVYAARTIWRPLLVISLVLIISFVSPQLGAYRHLFMGRILNLASMQHHL